MTAPPTRSRRRCWKCIPASGRAGRGTRQTGRRGGLGRAGADHVPVNQGRGTLKIADVGLAELEPYRGPNGAVTTLTDTIFSTVPGAPVFVGKATRYVRKIPSWATISTSQGSTPCRARSSSTASANDGPTGGTCAGWFPPLATGLVVLSWIALLVWDTSPYARYLNHGDWSEIGLGAAICASVPGGHGWCPSCSMAWLVADVSGDDVADRPCH